MKAICKGQCPWVIFASKQKAKKIVESFVISMTILGYGLLIFFGISKSMICNSMMIVY